MNKKRFLLSLFALLFAAVASTQAQERRPIDNEHPLWFIHVDVWYKADPQKIIDLIPDDVKPYVCLNLSLSCGYDKEKNVYKMPQQAVRTYKSWATVCQKNRMWFTCQPASGGHTHIQDDDLATFEYFFKRFPNFLGWNYAEQFWGFDEAGDMSSSTQASRIALFAKLVPMHHQYGGFLTISFCGNIWSHPLNPMGMMKRNKDLLNACKQYPEAILWLYKYTTSSCFYNNESVTYGPYISGLAKNYGVRYDNCGWNGALDAILGQNHGKKYPAAAGIGTVMEQMASNGGAVWDGPELTWREECLHEVNNSTVDGYTRRNWAQFTNFKGVWLDMFRQVINGGIYIPTREEVLGKTKIVVINDRTSGNDEEMYAAWGSLYDGLYKQTDPFNRGNGQWMENYCYLKKTGRYGAIPLVIGLYDDAAKAIPVQVKKSAYASRWSTQTKKVNEFNAEYPEVSKGDLFVSRLRNQLVTYTPYTYLNKKKDASAEIPLLYNSCDSLRLHYGKLSSGIIREYADHIDFYLNNYRSDTIAAQTDEIVVTGVTAEPAYTLTKHTTGATGYSASATANYDAEAGTYTVSVKHNGPVNLVINCTGEATDLLTDGIATATALPEPTRPEAVNDIVIIEAEDMDFKNVKSCVTDPYNWYPAVRGHSGNGFIDFGTNSTAALRHQLNCDFPGEYDIDIRYTCTSKTGNLAVTVNGTRQNVKCEKTAQNEWRKVSVSATLKEGKNDLVITNVGALPAYIDQIVYKPAGTPKEKYLITVRTAENGVVTADVAEAAEGDTVRLSVKADEGFALKELRVVNSVFYTLSKTIAFSDGEDEITFVMPEDNVTIQPVFADMTSVYKLDFTTVQGGTIPPGWRCVQENNETHVAPNNYSQGARTFAGFTGYQGKALYWRNEYCDYGCLSDYPLTLQPGDYKLTFAMAAWKGSPKYKVQIFDANTNKAVATSQTYTATPNVNGNTAGSVKSAQLRELPFTISEAGNYYVRFSDDSNAGGFTEFLLLECRINTVAAADAIPVLSSSDESVTPVAIYDLQGRRQPALQRGINIVRTADGKTRKINIK